MENNISQILEASEAYVRNYMRTHFDERFVYHNITHTEDVVKASQEIGKGSNLNDEEVGLVKLAAWFHDIGYVEQPKDHEAKSIEIASEFLKSQGINGEKLKIVEETILSTKMPQTPSNSLQKVICDADLHSLGSKNFFEKSNLLRNERELINEIINNEVEWLQHQVDFLDKHKYHTPFAKATFGTQKLKNLNKLNKRLDKEREVVAGDGGADLPKSKKPSRGIETLFRQTLRNHTTLSAIADNKANIMLSINAIILSIVISTLVPKFQTNSELIIPTCVLIFVCVATIIFATLSTRPKITQGTFRREDVLNKRANLVFFGNFYNMELEEFEWAMGEVLKDEDFLYGSLKRDLFFLGKVLARKYKYLSITYAIFMYGIILTVIAFGIVFILPSI